MPIGGATAYTSALPDLVSRVDVSREAVKRALTPASRGVRQHDSVLNTSNNSFAKHQPREIPRIEGLRTVDLAVRPATVLFAKRENSSNFIDVADASGSFSVPKRELRVKLAEGPGQMRTVSIRSVTFGSQQMLEHAGSVASSSSTQGIW
jgi:hypothetical protein